GHEEGREHHPLRSRDVGIDPEDLEVPVGDPLETLPHFLRGELVAVLAERRGLVEGDLLLLLATMGAALPLRRLPRGLLRDVLDVLLPAKLLHLLHLVAELLRLLF